MKKIYILFITTLLMFIILLCDFSKGNIIENRVVDTSKHQLLSMMIETDANSGVYEESENSIWPQDGYTFNSQLSKCENGSTITWDDETKSVKVNSNVSDKCYVYFDEVPLLAAHIKSKYTSQGANGLYYHDSSLANGANDGSYRYAGANPNNYVCFGTDVIPCPKDNLYRIIGVFVDQVKLVANEFFNGIGGEHYNPQEDFDTLFFNKLEVKYQNKIATSDWQVGAIDADGTTDVKQYYERELGKDSKNEIATSKIGLIYVSDYGYAANPLYWNTPLYNYDNSNIRDELWMRVSGWTITPVNSFYPNDRGPSLNFHIGAKVDGADYGTWSLHVYLSFYLNTNVTYVSGTGTQNDPILIN